MRRLLPASLLLLAALAVACSDDEPPPIPTLAPTEAPTATLLPGERQAYVYIGANTYGDITLDVSSGMPTRTICPSDVYEGADFEFVDCYTLNGMVLNVAAIPDAEERLQDAIDYALLLAWSAQDAIPAAQADLAVLPEDDLEARLQKLAAMQERMDAGEELEITMLAFRDGTFALEPVTFTWGGGWTYYIDFVEAPTPFITWQRDIRSGVRIYAEAKVFRFELYARWAGYQGSRYEDFYISTLMVDILNYLPELTRSEKLPDLFAPHGLTQLSLIDGIYDIAGTFLIPGAVPGSKADDWDDSVIHPVP